MSPNSDAQKEESMPMTSTDAKETKEKHWIRGVVLCAEISAGVLVINLIFVGIAAGLSRRYSDDNAAFSSIAVVYRGNCTSINRWEIALHLLINILSTAVLAASNYSMQTLAAPTRQEIDRCHAKHKWLDIGSASIRNLSVIPKSSLALWFVLMITATPFHLIYNSIVFKSIPANYYDVVLGPTDLDIPGIGNLSTPNLAQCLGRYPAHYPYESANYSWNDFVSDLETGNYKTLDNNECTAFTNQNNQAGVKFMMMLTSDVSVKEGGNESILIGEESAGGPNTNSYYIQGGHVSAIPSGKVSSSPYIYFTILQSDGDGESYTLANFSTASCMSYEGENSTCTNAENLVSWFNKEQPSREQLDEYMQANITSNIIITTYGTECLVYADALSYSVDGSCIAIETDEICELIYSPYISVVISLTLFVKIITLTLVARFYRSRSVPILTIGDAISSFITNPDSTTEGMCWASRADFSPHTWKARHIASSGAESHRQYEPKNLQGQKRWMHAPSINRWLVAFLTSAIIFVASAVLLNEGVRGEQAVLVGDGTSTSTSAAIRRLLENGFNSNNYLSVTFGSVGGAPDWPMLTYAVIASIPQLALTLTYYWYNHILTNMLANAEYSSYGVNRKSLRVTWPAKDSQQRSTYYLSLPYRYSVPLMVVMTLLHWLLSQCFFYVYSIPWADDQRLEMYMTSQLGFLWLPTLLAVILGGVMIVVLIGLSFRKYKSAMPVVGSCSAAISAACHAPNHEDLNQATLGLLMWGETVGRPAWEIENEIGEDRSHCSFTSLETIVPTLEKLYA